MIDKNPDRKAGYGNPPKQHYFKKGQSGNPKGRPKKPKDVPGLVDRELSKKVRIKEQGEVRTVTKLEAMVTGLVAKALGGDHRALKLVLDLKRQHIDPDEFEIGVDADAMLMDYLSKELNSNGAENEE